MSQLREDRGQALVVVALGMVVLLGFLGLGLDMGYMRLVKRQVQQYADAAAIAGAEEFNYCSGTANCTDMTTAAQDAVTENGFTSTTLVKNCASTTATAYVMVNNPPCYLGSKTADPHYNNSAYVEVVVGQQVNTVFASVFGVPTETIVARAEGTLPGGGTCMFTLGTSGAGISLYFSFGGGFSSPCGWVDESASSNAFTGFLDFFNTSYFGIVGGNSCAFCFDSGSSISTGITTPTPADPLAYLQSDLESEAPNPASCGTYGGGQYTGYSGQLTINSLNSSKASPAILNPGTYCGGINITSTGYATLNSGIYTLTTTSSTNGGLTIDPSGTVSGSGVGFYNYGSATYTSQGGIMIEPDFATAGAVSLVAPNATNCGACGSAWQGILFFQNPQDTATSYVIGSSFWNTNLTGTTYLPSANVTYAVDFAVNYNDIVSKSVTLGFTFGGQNVNADFNDNYSELANGNPIKSSVAVLAE